MLDVKGRGCLVGQITAILVKMKTKGSWEHGRNSNAWKVNSVLASENWTGKV